MTLYDILEIKEFATKEEIIHAFRIKAKKIHPDINKNSNDDFIQLYKAYEILSNDEKRKLYDMSLKPKLHKIYDEDIRSEDNKKNKYKSVLTTTKNIFKQIIDFIICLIAQTTIHLFMLLLRGVIVLVFALAIFSLFYVIIK